MVNSILMLAPDDIKTLIVGDGKSFSPMNPRPMIDYHSLSVIIALPKDSTIFIKRTGVSLT